MKKTGFSIAIFFILIFLALSCAPVRKSHYEDKRRGLLMLEGEHVYKNKGFYNNKKTQKRHKKNLKYHKKKRRQRR